MFGKPEYISAVEHLNMPYCQTVSTNLYYKDTTVIANCAWDVAIPEFSAKYHARFDRGAVVYENEILTVYPYDNKPFTPQLEGRYNVAEGIRYIVELVLDESMQNLRCPPSDTCTGVRIIDAIKKSASRGGERIKFGV